MTLRRVAEAQRAIEHLADLDVLAGLRRMDDEIVAQVHADVARVVHEVARLERGTVDLRSRLGSGRDSTAAVRCRPASRRTARVPSSRTHGPACDMRDRYGTPICDIAAISTCCLDTSTAPHSRVELGARQTQLAAPSTPPTCEPRPHVRRVVG